MKLKLVFMLLSNDYQNMKMSEDAKRQLGSSIATSFHGVVNFAICVVAICSAFIPIRFLENHFPFSTVFQAIRVITRIELASSEKSVRGDL